MNSRIKFVEKLLGRYLTGKATPEERAVVDAWYDTLPEREEESRTEAEWLDLREKMRSEVDRRRFTQTDLYRKRMTGRWWSVAAAIALLIAAGWWWMHRTPVSTAGLDNVVCQNSSKQPQTFQLPDSSQVTLQQGSRVYYARAFNGTERTVYLEGEATFQVRSNAQRPFLVHCGAVVTKVLGTVFTVKEGTDKNVVVAVQTGRVAVFRPTTTKVKDNGVIVTPNQQATYLPDKAVFVTALVEQPALVYKEQGTQSPSSIKPDFNFAGVPLRAVVERLEAAYGIEVELESERLSQCDFRGDLSNMPFYTQLDALCHALHATYEVKGLKILISGHGCL